MEKERLIAWSSAIIVTLVIIMAGKSCMGTPTNTKKENTSPTQAATTAENNAEENGGFQINYPVFEDSTEAQIIGHDIFGKPIYATEAATEDTQEFSTDTGDISAEPVTNAEGNITKQPTDEADIGTEPTDSTQPATIPPGFSGYDHGVYDDEGNVVATVPPDFVIIVE